MLSQLSSSPHATVNTACLHKVLQILAYNEILRRGNPTNAHTSATHLPAGRINPRINCTGHVNTTERMRETNYNSHVCGNNRDEQAVFWIFNVQPHHQRPYLPISRWYKFLSSASLILMESVKPHISKEMGDKNSLNSQVISSATHSYARFFRKLSSWCPLKSPSTPYLTGIEVRT